MSTNAPAATFTASIGPSSGDIEQGFKESDEIIENVYKIPPMQHGHIEPHVVTALWEPSGKLVVHTPSQTPSPLQEQIAKVFKLPLNRVRVIVPFIGGGYGGKNHARIEPVVALLARKARRPVQWILTRDEVFLTGRRFGAVVKIKTGFKRDGRLWARKVEAWYDMGAYALSGPANTKNACIIAGGPYNIPHRDYTTYAVYTNLPPAGPYRGVGASHVCWAYESDIDDIARRCNLDPLEIRLKNLLQENDRFITGEPMISVGVSECVKQVAQSINWQPGAEQSLRSDAMATEQSLRSDKIVLGKGLAVAIKSTSTPSTSAASVRLNADGSAILLTSTSDMGQGAQTASGADRCRRIGAALRTRDRHLPRQRCYPLRQIHQLEPRYLSHGQSGAASMWQNPRTIVSSRREITGSAGRRSGAAR